VGFLDGGVSAVFDSIFSPIYLDATLFRKPTYSDDGAGGGEDNETDAGQAVKVQPEATTQAMRETEGYADTDKRYLMLAHGIAEPSTDCELVAEDQRWSVFNWSRDPASAYYDLHCRFLSATDVS
jgi:hypothetical protein